MLQGDLVCTGSRLAPQTEHPFMVDTLLILLKASYRSASPPVNPTLADSNKDVTRKMGTPGIFASKVF